MASRLLFFVCAFGLFVVHVNTKALSIKTRERCCSLGTNHSISEQDCRSFRPLNLGVEPGEETACRIIADVCCKKQIKLLQCDLGKKDANQGICSSEDGERKECCSACLVGIEIGKASEPCVDSLGFGPPYDNAFISCCKESKDISTTSTSTTTTTTTTQKTKTSSLRDRVNTLNNTLNNQVLPGLSEENICQTSEYCAQLCKTTQSGTYECACFDGYVLMDDGVSCKPVKRSLSKYSGRCQIHNPCDHDCIDTGTQIKCTCRDGYELAEDKKTCKDIDECALNLHDCTANEECSNEDGGFDCFDPTLSSDDYETQSQCPVGYKFNSEKLTCDDIDECEFGIVCAAPKVCKNSIGSFTCEGDDIPQCPPGFQYKASIATCADIDECITGEHNCNKESQVCLNTKGNYTCVEKTKVHSCPPGFKKNVITNFCEDIDECMEDSLACAQNERCINEEGGHSCEPLDGPVLSTVSKPPPIVVLTTTPKPVKCPRGFRYVKEQNACEDINECLESPETCDSSSTCVNTHGSYVCQCKIGFQNDPVTGACEDINECVTDSHVCTTGQRCDNTPGSYLCTRIFGCGTGYTLNHASGLCEDDDECKLGTHNCHRLGSQYKCRNLLGSYRCDFVRPQPVVVARYTTRRVTTPTTTSTTTTTTTPRTTTSTTTTTTPAPIRREQFYNPYVVTSQRAPYYQPVAPPQVQSERPYYPTRETPRTYEDTPPIPLYQNTTPINYFTSTRPTPVRTQHQSYQIPYSPQDYVISQRKQCLPGYYMNSRGECEDIDECQHNPCPKNTKCVNFNGRFECASPMQCKIGYELNEDGDKCVDVNECARGTHRCHYSQICKNADGYYTCECPPGHHLSRTTDNCEDIDECKIYRPCGSNSDCINTKGSYQCNCKSGFRKTSTSCIDIDECVETPGLCEHTCVNTWGSFRCACKRGFRLNHSDNRTCIDVNECEEHKNTRLCIGNCQNVLGSYKCACPPGYRLGSDGRICLDNDECLSNICGYEDVCLNTRGSYKCYPINCPPNYLVDSNHKSRCKRVCDPRDSWCSSQPDQYTYQFVSLASELPINGRLQLFQIKGPNWAQATAEFSLKVIEARAPPGVEQVTDSFFQKASQGYNSMSIYMVRSAKGPQEVKLQVEMKLHDGSRFIGSTVIYIIIDVSQYSF